MHCGGVSYKQGQAEQHTRTARQRRSWLGEWAATKLGLNMTTAPGPGAGVTADTVPPEDAVRPTDRLR